MSIISLGNGRNRILALAGMFLPNLSPLGYCSIACTSLHYNCSKLKKDLTVSIIKYQGILEKAIQDVYYLHSKCEFDIEIAEPKEKSAIRDSIYGQLKPVLEKYPEETLKQNKIINGHHTKFRRIINDRLCKISEA